MTIEEQTQPPIVAAPPARPWPASACRTMAVAIVQRMVNRHDRIVWPDEIDSNDIEGDERNAIGQAWQRLVKLGIIRRTNVHRRSRQKESRGRVIFSYRLTDEPKAKEFLRINSGQEVMDL